MSASPLVRLVASPLPVTSFVVLDGCAFATMLATLYPLMTQGFADARKRAFAFACMTHMAASALALIYDLVAGGPVVDTSAAAADLGTTLILDVASLAFLAAALLRRNQRNQRNHRDQARARREVSHVLVFGMVLAALPGALAVATFLWHGSLAAVRFAYALSLTMLLSVFAMERDVDLSAREADVALRQSRALADQMRPHFIFNALSTIQGLCYADPEAAATQVEQFSDYLRGHIDALAESGLVPFETEVGHAREYASLSRAGSSMAFELVWDLRETAFLVPSLTIQPIVENAIRYGALARSDGQGVVRVTSERRGDFARVSIQDNGPGIDVLGRRSSDRRGIGLASAKERLKVQCGGSLTVSTDERGTKVVIVVPLDCDAWRVEPPFDKGALS